ncbi:WD40 repeat-like protein [Cristinia sonorae]|uniref:WD40 repeat-like protein n=1 Tax=Cristinia sonorae TaxID=1940300 RepID=A0A8K0UT68_9AGAR|nr:WD40 repeat-like protein [Cristinia sonorae]
MRVRTLEIRWHDSKPISTCDFQPIPYKKARPTQDKAYVGQAYKLATGGEDNHVRLWTVHPNILPSSVVAESAAATSASGSNASAEAPVPRPPRVEYVATLSRHSAAVNVVRFSPNGDLIASAGDDGMIIIWAPSASPQTSTYGSDLSPEELQYEKEHWKPRTTFRCTTMQVYDLAWSPTGEYIIAGSTDNCARIFTSADGKCVHEIAEHNHFVQGVAWDPLNEYVATQSSDRSMHIYNISQKNGTLEVHAVSKNARMAHRHARTASSHSRPRPTRRESTASEAESILTSASELTREESSSSHTNPLMTPTASVPSTPSSMFPPPSSFDKPTSRRSSFSGSNAAASPASYARYGRSPSPMPALPAIRMSPSSSASAWQSVKLYGDESFTNFFRRLAFSPDGGLLLTPAGQFEDPAIQPSLFKTNEERGRKGNPTPPAEDAADPSSSSCVYIYSRANFARPPIARLPGHKKPSVAVKFSPILYELRAGVGGLETPTEPKTVPVERSSDALIDIDLAGPSPNLQPHHMPDFSTPLSPLKLSGGNIAAPSPRMAVPPSPALSATESLRPPTPMASKPGTPAITPIPSVTSSIFALPYRMLYAVATMDTVAIHDTQQAGPVCLLTKLHYDEFTDMSWSPDGQCLILSSRDGYCTIVVFDDIMTAHHTQQQTLQLQSIAHHHSLPLTNSTVATPLSTPSIPVSSLPNLNIPSMSPVITPTVMVPMKRPAAVEPPLTPAASVDESVMGGYASSSTGDVGPGTSTDGNDETVKEPPKKKRRAALTRIEEVPS